ncbi:3-oxoacyl-[acyl-carrier-protein] reductase [Limosilactobacillus mucosae]|uniref:3-oxoacyl-[acyl-carrier-protein] reductase n=1 Tax=Limosilactobacillus mucosae TaxID=97478 RepID=UPI00089158EE|nr:3-oxoacyl-[acyl-carrier-protein] reductase [Limosilactobacillus mucosae]SDN24500.1 3-oxoacyl-[acyl-carrier-protein] reductase [Limosilactobacillus mucosae]SEK71136.1 3-oxoacyl-[acyl-carrier-protein] reductase [Limosilactobacillus mucosae]SFK07303.1 3-oxoacyl-[acyl-carrier-protein] reductase [Limosilactobacillus mucosae]
MELTNKTVLITGSSRGIGAATALAFAKAGSRVILNARHELPSSLKQQLEEIGAEYCFLSGDVSNEQVVKELAKTAWEKFGGIDVLINNAGITRDRLLIGMKAADFDEVLQVNLKGPFLMIQALLKKMYKQRAGVIINLASVVGLHGNAGQANYAASKAGIIGLTKTVAREGALRGIRCNAIAPGMIASDMTAAMPQKARDQILESLPLKRFGEPAEIAQTALFLAQNDYVTGQTIVVDGGMTI